MKALIYGNRKSEEIWDISTPEKEEAAYRELFYTLDTDWEVYVDLAEPEPRVVCEACQKGYHKGCEDTDSCACDNAMCPTARKNSTYEAKVLSRWPELYKKAKAGDFPAMKKLLTERSTRHYEYEEFHIGEVKDATAKKKAASD